MTKHQINTLSTLLIISVSFFSLENKYLFWVIFGITIALHGSILLFGIFNIRFNYFLKSKNKINKKYCLLTFDDGPSKEYTSKIIKILDQHKIGAIFFVIGSKAKNNKPIINQIIKSGHWVGNHSYSHHNNFAFKALKKVSLELQDTESIIKLNSKSLFRPPVGITNPIIARALKRHNLKSIGWSLRSLDTVYKDKELLLSRLLSRIKNGDIVLLHDNLEITSEILSEFISESKNYGINFVSPYELNTIFDD